MTTSSTAVLGLALVAPREDAEAEDAFRALSALAEARTGTSLRRVATGSYDELLRTVRAREAELAWLPPVLYAWLVEAVNPLGHVVRRGATRYGSALIVPKESPIRTLEDLRGVRAGWVDRFSAAGYVVPRLELARRGLDPTRTFGSSRFFGTHDDVLRALADGACDVVATYARAPVAALAPIPALPRDSDDDDDDDDHDKTNHGGAGSRLDGPWVGRPDVDARLLALLGSIPPDVVAARRDLSPGDFERARALFKMASSDPEGRALLARVFHGESIALGVEVGHEELRLAYESGLAAGLFD